MDDGEQRRANYGSNRWKQTNDSSCKKSRRLGYMIRRRRPLLTRIAVVGAESRAGQLWKARALEGG